jgi:hypothetical protein
MAKVRTQPERRQNATLIDQHGRKWAVTIERDTMHPCSTPRPKGWEAPKLAGQKALIPPEQYLSYPPDDPFTMKIDYDQIIADRQDALREWEDRLRTNATMLYGSGAVAAIQRNDPELVRFTGAKPEPAEPWMACRQGNKFALGLSKKMPEWAIPFFSAPAKVERVFEDAYEDEEEQGNPNNPLLADEDEPSFEAAVENESLLEELESETEAVTVPAEDDEPEVVRSSRAPAARRQTATTRRR